MHRQLYTVLLEDPDIVHPVRFETADTVAVPSPSGKGSLTFIKEKLAYIGYDRERAQRISTKLTELKRQKQVALNNILSMYEQGVADVLKAA